MSTATSVRYGQVVYLSSNPTMQVNIASAVTNGACTRMPGSIDPGVHQTLHEVSAAWAHLLLGLWLCLGLHRRLWDAGGSRRQRLISQRNELSCWLWCHLSWRLCRCAGWPCNSRRFGLCAASWAKGTTSTCCSAVTPTVILKACRISQHASWAGICRHGWCTGSESLMHACSTQHCAHLQAPVLATLGSTLGRRGCCSGGCCSQAPGALGSQSAAGLAGGCLGKQWGTRCWPHLQARSLRVHGSCMQSLSMYWCAVRMHCAAMGMLTQATHADNRCGVS